VWRPPPPLGKGAWAAETGINTIIMEEKVKRARRDLAGRKRRG